METKTNKMKILIIGGVAGGATAAARLRRLNEGAEIILFEKGEYVSYANCGLPYYIGDTISERDRLFLQTVEGFSKRYGVDARVNSEVTAIDTKKKTISVKNWKTGKDYDESYDKLILSTGSSPIKLNLSGADDKRIFSLRDVADTDNIKSFINEHKPKKAVVIGAGFIGLEMVENLHELGIEVSVVQRENQVMNPLDMGMAAVVHKTLAEKGVQVYLEENLVGFKDSSSHLNVLLESGKELEADLVIMSVGVKPESRLAKEAGIALGEFGGIKVDKHMQTSDPNVYAVGDAVEVLNPTLNKYVLIPLAGPANKQGRIVADNVANGNKSKYEGSIGTAIAKIFDLTVASAGASSKQLQAAGIEHYESYTHANSIATYYPGSLPFSMKINFSKKDGKVLGAQAVGYEGIVDTINLLAEAIRKGETVYDLQEVEHAYAPPYSSAKHPVNIAGYVAQNILEGEVKAIQWHEIENLDKEKSIIIDTRTLSEYEMGHIDNAINIPVDEMRERLSEISKDKQLILYCAIGYRGYLATQILKHNGYENVYNLSGGYRTHTTAIQKHFARGLEHNKQEIKQESVMDNEDKKAISIDARGLMCPGPIMQLKKNYDKIGFGEQLEIKVTDQAFGQDLEGWSNMVGAKVLSLNNSGGVVTARVEKQEKDRNEAVGKTGEGQTLIVFSDDLDKALATFVIANGAAASGKKVSLFFTFWGLNVIKKTNKPKVKKDIFGKMFGMMMPSNSKKLGLSQMNMGGLGRMMMRTVMKKKNVETLENLMQQAHDNGVEFIACSMSMDVMGVQAEELMDSVVIGGVAAYLDRADKSNINLFI